MTLRPILSTLKRHRTATALIVIEIALACAILCNALFIVGERLRTVALPSGIAEAELVQIRLTGIGKDDNADVRTVEDLATLRALPGVLAATIVNQVPFQSGSWNIPLSLRPEQTQASVNAAHYLVGEAALRTLGLKLIAGRDFLPDEYRRNSELGRDRGAMLRSTTFPAVISAELARALFHDESPLSRTVYMAGTALRIVGVVERLARPNAPGGNRSYSIVLPFRPNYNDTAFYLLRTTPERRQHVLEAAAAALERNGGRRLLLQQRSYHQIRAEHFRNDRDMIGLLLIVCAALLAITALGIFGLASFWVAQRTRQIGVRRALGATRRQILRYFQAENFLLSSAGIVLGMLAAYALNLGLMRAYELPRLPLIYLPIGAAFLWLLGQLSVLAPARRAAAVPPATATRSL